MDGIILGVEALGVYYAKPLRGTQSPTLRSHFPTSQCLTSGMIHEQTHETMLIQLQDTEDTWRFR